MSPLFLSIYALVGLLEVSFKIVFIVTVYREKIRLSTDCTEAYYVKRECVDWRLDDLNLTNSAIFHIVSGLSQAFLILFTIQLLWYARRLLAMRRKIVGIDNLSCSYSMSSETSIDTIAYAGGLSAGGTGQSSLITGDPAIRQSASVDPEAKYGTFRRICYRFSQLTSNPV